MDVTKGTVRGICTDAVFERGEKYFSENRILDIHRVDATVTAVVNGNDQCDARASISRLTGSIRGVTAHTTGRGRVSTPSPCCFDALTTVLQMRATGSTAHSKLLTLTQGALRARSDEVRGNAH